MGRKNAVIALAIIFVLFLVPFFAGNLAANYSSETIEKEDGRTVVIISRNYADDAEEFKDYDKSELHNNSVMGVDYFYDRVEGYDDSLKPKDNWPDLAGENLSYPFNANYEAYGYSPSFGDGWTSTGKGPGFGRSALNIIHVNINANFFNVGVVTGPYMVVQDNETINVWGSNNRERFEDVFSEIDPWVHEENSHYERVWGEELTENIGGNTIVVPWALYPVPAMRDQWVFYMKMDPESDGAREDNLWVAGDSNNRWYHHSEGIHAVAPFGEMYRMNEFQPAEDVWRGVELEHDFYEDRGVGKYRKNQVQKITEQHDIPSDTGWMAEYPVDQLAYNNETAEEFYTEEHAEDRQHLLYFERWKAPEDQEVRDYLKAETGIGKLPYIYIYNFKTDEVYNTGYNGRLPKVNRFGDMIFTRYEYSDGKIKKYDAIYLVKNTGENYKPDVNKDAIDIIRFDTKVRTTDFKDQYAALDTLQEYDDGYTYFWSSQILDVFGNQIENATSHFIPNQGGYTSNKRFRFSREVSFDTQKITVTHRNNLNSFNHNILLRGLR